MSIPLGSFSVLRRNASRTSRLTRFRTLARPTFRLTVTPIRVGPPPFPRANTMKWDVTTRLLVR